jgi:peptidoglycan/xylan/chitin deacetylase (PgdA/CDA1 family)
MRAPPSLGHVALALAYVCTIATCDQADQSAETGHDHDHQHDHPISPWDPNVEMVSQMAVTYPAIDFNPRPTNVPNNVIGLTFDDGPDALSTPRVLDVLQAKNVKATFFINTDNWGTVDSDTNLKNIIKRIVNEGHQLASHTVHHSDLATLSTTAIRSEITGVQTTVNRSDVLGSSFPKLTMLRAPFGSPYQTSAPGSAAYDKVAPIVGEYAVHMGWAIDTFDYNCTSGTAAQKRDCVINNFTSRVRTVGTGDYGMVLMHSVQPQTADAIGAIIDYCRNNGFVFQLGEYFVGRAFNGRTSNEVIYGTTPPTCTQTPFGGAARAIPGTIQAEDFDNGGNNCAYMDTTSGNSLNGYRTTESVDIQTTTDTGGGFNIGAVQAGEYLDYTVSVGTAGNYRLELRVSATTTGKTVDVLMDGALIADNLAVPNTGNYQTFATINVPSVALTAGTKELKVLFNQSSQNLNWIRFTSVTTCTPESNATFCSRLGKNCGTVSGTDNCGAPRTVSPCGSCTSPQVCGASNVCQAPSGNQYSYVEAEAMARTSPMVAVTEAGASGGQVIWSGTSGSNAAVPATGHATFTFNVPTAGTFQVWGRFLVGPATTSDDSLWARIDNGAWTQWNDIFQRIGAGFGWDREHNTITSGSNNVLISRNLTAGNHTLEVAYRENGLKLDRFLITNDLAFVPAP